VTAGLDFGALMNASALLFSAFGLALVFFARDIDDWPKGLSVAILSSAAVLSALELLDHAVADTGVSPTLLLVLRNVEVVTAALPSLLMFAYFLYCCGEDYKKSAVMRIQVALTCTLVAAEFLAQLTGEISSAPGAETRLGPWIVLFLALSFATTVVCLVALFRRWKKLSGVQRVMFLIMFLLSFFATDSIVIVFLEFLLSSDLVRHYLAQKEEAAQQQARIAVLQMRPHFIHNTLTSIYYLCAKDPGKAQQAILNFSRYLQNNFDAIVEEGAVPFTEELEHAKAYLAVEQACHEGQLLVELDTPVTFFRIPPLTLQPIVENAVKHGLDPDSEPLRIAITTRDTGPGVEIAVADTGPGFTPPDEGQGFALENIRGRLKAQCDGTLAIEAPEEGGTKATIFIPWKQPIES